MPLCHIQLRGWSVFGASLRETLAHQGVPLKKASPKLTKSQDVLARAVTGSVHMPVHRQRRRRAWMIGAANVSPSRCLQAVGPECGLIGGECGPEPPLVGAECEPKMPLVCRSGCRCLQAVTARAHLLPEAGGQRTLEAVRCSPLLGGDSWAQRRLSREFSLNSLVKAAPRLPFQPGHMPTMLQQHKAKVLQQRCQRLLDAFGWMRIIIAMQCDDGTLNVRAEFQ